MSECSVFQTFRRKTVRLHCFKNNIILNNSIGEAEKIEISHLICFIGEPCSVPDGVEMHSAIEENACCSSETMNVEKSKVVNWNEIKLMHVDTTHLQLIFVLYFRPSVRRKNSRK